MNFEKPMRYFLSFQTLHYWYDLLIRHTSLLPLLTWISMLMLNLNSLSTCIFKSDFFSMLTYTLMMWLLLGLLYSRSGVDRLVQPENPFYFFSFPSDPHLKHNIQLTEISLVLFTNQPPFDPLTIINLLELLANT